MIAPSLMDPSSHIIYYNLTEDTRTKKYDFSICEFCPASFGLSYTFYFDKSHQHHKKPINWFLNYVLKNRETIVNIPFPLYR